MAVDEAPQNQNITSSGPWVVVFVILGLLVIGEIYTLAKIGSIGSLKTEQASLKTAMQQSTDQLASKLSSFEDQSAQQLDALRGELDSTAKRMGSTGRALTHARTMVSKLEKQTQAQADELKQEIAKKADDEKVGALSQDVSATKTDLGTTKQNVDQLTKDLGMARSEMGTLIARNHDDIETLRKLGMRDYYEFTLTKNQEQTVAGIGLTLKKTNIKHHRFNLNVLTNDMEIQKNNRTLDEPIFFSAGGSKSFDELVINKEDANSVTGYLSTAKFSQPELATASSNPSAQ